MTAPSRRSLAFALVVGAITLAGPALASEVAMPVRVLGRLHFPLLHFPIALLLAALGVELFFRRKMEDGPRARVVAALTLAAAASAVFTVVSGLAYAQGEDFGGAAADTFNRHRAGGIAVAVLSVVAFAATRLPAMARATLPALGLASLGVLYVGHEGGELVHGAGFFGKAFSAQSNSHTDDDGGEASKTDDDDDDDDAVEARLRYPEGDVPEKPDYLTHVKPIFDRSCVKCHGPEKRKSGLRLDQKRFAMKGGESGDVIIPGNADKSLVYSMTALAPDDEDVMPPKGKLLSLSEQQVLKRWIDQGAEWPEDG